MKSKIKLLLTICVVIALVLTMIVPVGATRNSSAHSYSFATVNFHSQNTTNRFVYYAYLTCTRDHTTFDLYWENVGIEQDYCELYVPKTIEFSNAGNINYIGNTVDWAWVSAYYADFDNDYYYPTVINH